MKALKSGGANCLTSKHLYCKLKSYGSLQPHSPTLFATYEFNTVWLQIFIVKYFCDFCEVHKITKIFIMEMLANFKMMMNHKIGFNYEKSFDHRSIELYITAKTFCIDLNQ